MSDKLFKLSGSEENNKKLQPMSLETSSTCNHLPNLTTNEEVNNPEEIKEMVRNFRNVTAKKMNINPKLVFQTVPIHIKYIYQLLNGNWEGLAGLRVYLAKETADENELDYRLILVPCTWDSTKNILVDKEPKIKGDDDIYVYASDCRRPPDCPEEGAIFLGNENYE